MCWLTNPDAIAAVTAGVIGQPSAAVSATVGSAAWLAVIGRGARACFEINTSGIGGAVQLMQTTASTLCVAASFSVATDAYLWLANDAGGAMQLLVATTAPASAPPAEKQALPAPLVRSRSDFESVPGPGHPRRCVGRRRRPPLCLPSTSALVLAASPHRRRSCRAARSRPRRCVRVLWDGLLRRRSQLLAPVSSAAATSTGPQTEEFRMRQRRRRLHLGARGKAASTVPLHPAHVGQSPVWLECLTVAPAACVARETDGASSRPTSVAAARVGASRREGRRNARTLHGWGPATQVRDSLRSRAFTAWWQTRFRNGSRTTTKRPCVATLRLALSDRQRGRRSTRRAALFSRWPPASEMTAPMGLLVPTPSPVMTPARLREAPMWSVVARQAPACRRRQAR